MKKLLTCLFSLLMAVAILSPVSMRAEVPYTIYFEVSENDADYGLDVKKWSVEGTADATYVENLFNYADSSINGASKVNDVINALVDSENYDAEGTLAEDYFKGGKVNAANWELSVKVISDDGYVYFNDKYASNGTGMPLAKTLDEDVTVTLTLTNKHDGNTKLDDRLETNVYVYLETEPGSGEYNAKAEKSFTAEIGSLLEDSKDMTSLLKKTVRDEDKNEYQLVFDTNEVKANAEVRGTWVLVDELPENRFGGKPSSKPSTPVYDELDTNHDGVVSCDEAHGEGWVWNEDKKACVYTGSTTSTVIVNTATK